MNVTEIAMRIVCNGWCLAGIRQAEATLPPEEIEDDCLRYVEASIEYGQAG